jgi:hypothetical protein
MKKPVIQVSKVKETKEELKKHKLHPDKQGTVTISVPNKLFDVGSLNKPYEKEYYLSYIGAAAIAIDYSRIKQHEVFGIWESDTYFNGRLLAIAYRGELFLRKE